MKKIEWGSFDGFIFQNFCNSVIILEVSKLAHVFNAAGKDAGIDQFYNGHYGGKIGKWRFQDKFHNSGQKANDITAFKRDILNDIKANYDGEDFIVYLTNVNLSPAKFSELMAVGTNALMEKDAASCRIFIWHEPKLLTVLEANPVLFNWYWEKENVLLQDYHSYFKRQLDPSPDLRYQLINCFFGRAQELKKLEDFLINPASSTMAIIANGGYGKTRLCTEFFSSLMATNNEWLPVVLTHSGFSPASLNVLLRTTTRLLLLIDNANEIPDVVNDVKQMIDNSGGRHKLLITARRSLFSVVMSKIPAYRNDIEVLELGRLGYDETKEMIINLLPYLDKKSVIYLANLSKGVPNVVLELARLIRMGKQPTEISSENFFSEGVRTIINEVTLDIHRSTNLPVEKVFDFLKLISVISPIPNNKESLEFIAKIMELRMDKLELLLNALEDSGIIDTHLSISIKPDPYSDAILAYTIQNNKGFVEHIRTQGGMEKYFENILKNLAEAEVSKKEANHFIQDLLVGYVKQIEDRSTSTNKIKAIFEFTESIVFSHPSIAKLVIRSFITIYTDSVHPIHTETSGWSTKTFAEEIKETTDKIIVRLYSQTQYGKDNLANLHELLVEYCEATDDTKIIASTYGYHEWEFRHGNYRPRKCCERQDFLKGIIAKDLDHSDDILQLRIAVAGAVALLELDYQLETYFEEVTMQFTYGTGYIINCPHTEEIRSTVLDSLMAFFRRFSGDASLREATFAQFLHFFFHSSVNHEKRYRYQIDKEVTYVLTFLLDMIKQGSLKPDEKAYILDKARLFKGAGIRLPFIELINKITAAASEVESLYDDLEMCIVNQSYFDIRNNLEARIIRIVEEYNDFNRFRADLVKIYRQHQSRTQSFGSILNTINKHYPNAAKDFFEYIFTEQSDLTRKFITLVSANSKNPHYLYDVVHRLWKQKDKYTGAVLWLLTHGRECDRTHYLASDLDYFEAALEDGPEALNTIPFHQILEYAYIDKPRAFALLDKVMRLATGNHYNMLSHVLFDENSTYRNDFSEEIKDLLFKNLEKIIIDEEYYGDQPMAFLEEKYGFEVLLEFVYHKVNGSLQGEHYKFVTLNEHTYSPPKTSAVNGNERYLRFLEWFMNQETNEQEKSVGEYIMKLFRPSIEFTKSLSDEILKIASRFKDNQSQLLRLAVAIRLFPPKTEELIIALSRIAEFISEIPGSNSKENIHEIFGSNFYYNTGDVKSKSGKGIPYPEDVKKRDLFKKVLEENSFTSVIKKYLTDCQKMAQRDIDEEVARDKVQLRW